jgi:hypothetical protein
MPHVILELFFQLWRRLIALLRFASYYVP